MAWNQTNFDDALNKKYNILQQNADSTATSAGADVTRANASMLNVQQQPGLHQMDNDAAMQRTQYSSDTQNQMNQRDNNTRMAGQNQNYALGQADLGLKATTAAAQDQRERASASAGSTYDPKTEKWITNPAKFDRTSPFTPYLNNARFFGLQGFERGGTPPVNQPFVVGENGPETFIPADGGDPIVVGKNGPTVMTVPKPGFVEPSPKAVAQQARANLNQGQTGAAMSGVDAPWAGQSPRRSGLSPEGVVLPQEAPPAPPTVDQVIQDKLGPAPEPRIVQVGFGNNKVPMREINFGEAWKRADAEDRIRKEYEAASKQDFDPAAAEGALRNASPDERKNILGQMTPAQLDSLTAHRMRVQSLDAPRHQTGLPLIQGNGRTVKNETKSQSSADRGSSPEYISEYSDGTRIVKPEGDVTVEPDTVQQSLRSFLANRRAAMDARSKEIDAENQDMRKRQAALARRALGLGSYFVTAPDVAVYR